MSLVRRSLSAVALAAAPLLLNACSDKETGPTGPGSTALDPASVQEQSLATLGLVNGLVAGVDEWAQGDLSGIGSDLGLPDGGTFRGTEEPVWDPAQGAWVMEVQATETDESGATLTYDVSFWLQYTDAANQPQQRPDSTTEALSMVLDFDFDLEAEDPDGSIAMDLDFSMSLDVGGLPDGPYPLSASGELGFAMLWTGSEGGDVDEAFVMSWATDLNVPANGCPTGQAQVNAQTYSMVATFDGSDVYEWRLYDSGSLVDQGTESAGCGASPF